MKMTGEQNIAASRQKVWEALNDQEVLRQSIPGCQSLEKDADGRLNAVVAVKIGPIGARFAGAVTLSELDPPNGYKITGEGQGGMAGSAKGGAKVRLADAPGGTLLSYEVEAEVGGRLAQLGGPMIDATAKQLAGKFFEQFGAV
ncbi:MAG TPA: carbon monoxide dehydrogenase subunit G, partial [Acidocella sp.]|nr:carbon monoxide dehydrogenase subunit G [Acidocella sp.]